MGALCKKLAIVYGVLGGLGTLYLAYYLGAPLKYYGIKSERNWGITLAVFFGMGFAVAIGTAMLYTIGEIHDKLTSLYYRDKISFSEAESKGLAEIGRAAEEKKILSKGGWKCPKCDRLNYSYVMSCACGVKKDAKSSNTPDSYEKKSAQNNQFAKVQESEVTEVCNNPTVIEPEQAVSGPSYFDRVLEIDGLSNIDKQILKVLHKCESTNIMGIAKELPHNIDQSEIMRSINILAYNNLIKCADGYYSLGFDENGILS